MSVSANVLGDVHVKVEGFKKFAKELAEAIDGTSPRKNYPVGEDGDFSPSMAETAVFFSSLEGRILYGGLKYGPSSWKHVNLLAELKQELYDVAGYVFLELLKNPEANDLHREWLMSLAVEAFILWREVNDVE